jgi:hypothetical protein
VLVAFAGRVAVGCSCYFEAVWVDFAAALKSVLVFAVASAGAGAGVVVVVTAGFVLALVVSSRRVLVLCCSEADFDAALELAFTLTTFAGSEPVVVVAGAAEAVVVVALVVTLTALAGQGAIVCGYL